MPEPVLPLTVEAIQRIEHCEVFGLDTGCIVTCMDGDWALCEEHGRVETCEHVEAINEWLNNGE